MDINGVYTVEEEDFWRWVDDRLDELGLTLDELNKQHRSGAWSSDEARLLWFALP